MTEDTIYKYELNLHGITTMQMPYGAEVLCVQLQHDKPVFWAKVDPRVETESRSFVMITTGGYCYGERIKYIGTVQQDSGYVAHLFERL